jgi:hypothetical protein
VLYIRKPLEYLFIKISKFTCDPVKLGERGRVEVRLSSVKQVLSVRNIGSNGAREWAAMGETPKEGMELTDYVMV